MANQDIESIFEEKVDLEDLIIPTNQVQKVDEHLTIEFSCDNWVDLLLRETARDLKLGTHLGGIN